MDCEKNKLYVLVDRNLDPIYAAVQGGHAVAQWMLNAWTSKTEYSKDDDGNECTTDHPEWAWNNEYLIYLSVNINKWYKLLNPYNDKYYREPRFWYEPDLGNRLTAIAILGNSLPEELREKISKEQLLK